MQKVLGGFTKSPRRETLTALAGFLLPEQNLFIEQVPNSGTAQVPDSGTAQVPDSRTVSDPEISSQENRQQDRYGDPADVEVPVYLRDGAPAHVTGLPGGKKQGEYTIEDRNALPEDHPCELIDGVIYNMYSPTLRHQSVSGAIYRQLWNYVGVQEYWIVDLQKEKVIVYLFGEDSDVSLYGFDSEVPVGIYKGECVIDFRRIVGDLKRMHL